MAFKIAADKKKHFWVGIPLGMILQAAAYWLFPTQVTNSIMLAFIVLVAICYGFEFVSLITGKGHCDNMDAIAGIVGGVIGIGFIWVLIVYGFLHRIAPGGLPA